MYLDTAILVKLFVAEPDSEWFGKLVDGQNVSSSELAYVEFWSALLGKERAGAINAGQRQRAWEGFENAVQEETIRLEPLTSALFRRAHRILAVCHPKIPLRSLDALHLAACDHLQDWPLCTTDQRMCQAAEMLRFPIVGPPAK